MVNPSEMEYKKQFFKLYPKWKFRKSTPLIFSNMFSRYQYIMKYLKTEIDDILLIS